MAHRVGEEEGVVPLYYFDVKPKEAVRGGLPTHIPSYIETHHATFNLIRLSRLSFVSLSLSPSAWTSLASITFPSVVVSPSTHGSVWMTGRSPTLPMSQMFLEVLLLGRAGGRCTGERDHGVLVTHLHHSHYTHTTHPHTLPHSHPYPHHPLTPSHTHILMPLASTHHMTLDLKPSSLINWFWWLPR